MATNQYQSALPFIPSPKRICAPEMEQTTRSKLAQIPNVHQCLQLITASGLVDDVPLRRIKLCTRTFLETIRRSILDGHAEIDLLTDQAAFLTGLVDYIRHAHRPCLTRVINGTGVIVHTNLGRSLLPDAALDALSSVSRGYSNLELSLTTGKRGSRYQHVETLLCELVGAESALVVNNNAAAVLLALETIAKGREVIVSRGQLVEIGGSFRIPDIMHRSGAKLVEVGTTNRTHYTDYQDAINPETGLLLKVHCSNYRIIGFTSEVSHVDLVRLGAQHGLPVMEDLGSGCLIDLSSFGLAKEPTVQEVVASGVDIVTFSGDKLLGGPQAGIIVGKRACIDQIKSNPLNRAVRIDKLTLAALEAVLRLYLDEDQAMREIPTLAMIATPDEVVRKRAERLLQQCTASIAGPNVFSVVPTSSRVGGGALPEQNLASWALAVAVPPELIKISLVERKLRQAPVPVMGRMEADRLLFDLRTIGDDELDALVVSLRFALCLESD